MRLSKTVVFAIVAAIELIVILAIFLVNWEKGFSFRIFGATFEHNVVKQNVPTVINPLRIALRYDLSKDKFEKIVRDYPDWINYRTHWKHSINASILADCALLKKTNYVRVLIANGANVKEALKQDRLDKQAVELLREVGRQVSANSETRGDLTK